jgi:hypothetical protein
LLHRAKSTIAGLVGRLLAHLLQAPLQGVPARLRQAVVARQLTLDLGAGLGRRAPARACGPGRKCCDPGWWWLCTRPARGEAWRLLASWWACMPAAAGLSPQGSPLSTGGCSAMQHRNVTRCAAVTAASWRATQPRTCAHVQIKALAHTPASAPGLGERTAQLLRPAGWLQTLAAPCYPTALDPGPQTDRPHPPTPPPSRTAALDLREGKSPRPHTLYHTWHAQHAPPHLLQYFATRASRDLARSDLPPGGRSSDCDTACAAGAEGPNRGRPQGWGSLRQLAGDAGATTTTLRGGEQATIRQARVSGCRHAVLPS